MIYSAVLGSGPMEEVHTSCLLDSGAVRRKGRLLIQIRVAVTCVMRVIFQALPNSPFTSDMFGILKDTVLQFYNFLLE